jgi:hypothetical protein
VQSEGTESSAKRADRIFIHFFHLSPTAGASSNTHTQSGHTTSRFHSICFTRCADCCEFIATFAATMASGMSPGVFLCVGVILSFLATSGARLTPSNEGQIAMVTDSEALLAVDRFTDALGHHAHALAFAEFASKYVRRSRCYLVVSFLLVLDDFRVWLWLWRLHRGRNQRSRVERKVERISLHCVCSENFVIRSRFKILCLLQWEPRSCLRYRLLGRLSLRRGREESGTRVQAVS